LPTILSTGVITLLRFSLLPYNQKHCTDNNMCEFSVFSLPGREGFELNKENIYYVNA